MNKNIVLEEQDLGNGLYYFKVVKESSELPGNTISEKLKFAVKDFLKFPEKKHHAVAPVPNKKEK